MRKTSSPRRMQQQTPKKARRSLAELPQLPPPPTPTSVSPIMPWAAAAVGSSNMSRTCLQELPGAGISPRPVTATDKKVLTLLEELKSQVTQNTKLLNHLIRRADVRDQEESASSGIVPEDIVLPISSFQHFDEIERKLQTDVKQKQLVSYLGTIGGETVKECARRILLHTISHELALKFSWKGSTEKRAFDGTKLSSVVKSAVRKNRLTTTATDKEIGCCIQNWFRTAKDREGGRKERLKKKIANDNSNIANDNSNINNSNQQDSDEQEQE